VKNKDPPEVCPLVLAVSSPTTAAFRNRSMKIKKGRKITPDDVKNALGILANLVKLLYEIYQIVAHR
jgi:hypothetical protein